MAAEPVHVASDLLDALCEMAADREPSAVTVPLGVTPADELEDGPATDGPVFTHLYLPEAGRSVRAVFGVDLGTPSGASPGVFLSHPDGRAGLSKRDELREVAFVAVPPWSPAEVRAYDRRGRRRPIEALDVALPERRPP